MAQHGVDVCVTVLQRRRMPADILKVLLLPLALFVVLFGMGLSLTIADFRRVCVAPLAKLVGLACQILLLPLLALAVIWAFGLKSELAVGLMLLAACPGGPTSNLISHLARGDAALSVTLTAVSSVLTVFTLPWIMGWALQYFMGAGEEIALPFGKTMVQLALVTILPVALGMTVQRLRPAMAVRMGRPANVVSVVFLAAVIGMAVAREKDLLVQIVLAGPAAVALNVLAMTMGFLMARWFRLSLRQRITISVETGIQNGTLALGIALGILENARIAMPAVVYSLFMFVTGAVVIARFGWWDGRRANRGIGVAVISPIAE